MRKLWLAVLAALPCACLHEDDAKPARVWQGVVLRGCGPADGPQLDFYFDSVALACEPARSLMNASVAGIGFDSLLAGKTFVSIRHVECAEKCIPTEAETKLEILKVDADSVTVKFRDTRTPAEGGTPGTVEGSARFKLCRETPAPMCG